MPLTADTPGLSLLLIDDEEIVHKSVGRFLRRLGYRIHHAYNGEEGLHLFAEQGADIVISDIKMPGLDGFGLLRRLEEQQADVEVILVTGHGDMEMAVEALRQGAFDFFTKPIKLEELLASLERTRRYQSMRREKDRMQERLDLLQRAEGPSGARIIGESDAVRQTLELVAKVAPAERTTVLIQGESGTGKELVARAIHAQSPRAAGPFISLNCTAIPETLLESELFGHEKGAFTGARSTRRGLFELSRDGTLFLDEIGDMSPLSQSKILRALEEHSVRRVGGEQEIPVDVRLVAATHQDLDQLQAEGRFRQDLYFRLKVFTIHLPPLRQRGDDVLLLAHHFLHRFAREFGKSVEHIEAAARELLTGYAFPGNVRELRNLIERAVILCEGSSLTTREFADLVHRAPAAAPPAREESSLDLQQLERQTILKALEKAGHNQTAAARYLGIGQHALRYRLKKHGLL